MLTLQVSIRCLNVFGSCCIYLIDARLVTLYTSPSGVPSARETDAYCTDYGLPSGFLRPVLCVSSDFRSELQASPKTASGPMANSRAPSESLEIQLRGWPTNVQEDFVDAVRTNTNVLRIEPGFLPATMDVLAACLALDIGNVSVKVAP
jgi:hypothetical protein